MRVFKKKSYFLNQKLRYIHRALYVPNNCLAATVCFLFSGFGTLNQLCTLSRKLGEACSLWTWKRPGVSSHSVPCGSVYRAHKGTRLVSIVGIKSDLFTERVELCQTFFLSHILFIALMNRISWLCLESVSKKHWKAFQCGGLRMEVRELLLYSSMTKGAN